MSVVGFNLFWVVVSGSWLLPVVASCIGFLCFCENQSLNARVQCEPEFECACIVALIFFSSSLRREKVS